VLQAAERMEFTILITTLIMTCWKILL